MKVLLDRDVDVHYGFLTLAPEADVTPLEHLNESRGGQRNGLCGAQVPGCLTMVTGLHTGAVPVRVELHASAPAVDECWEEIVEVSVSLRDEPYRLGAFEDSFELVGLSPEAHRARWCASAMDAGRDLDCPGEGEHAPDRYLLQLWPAPAEPDAVLRQTSEIAAYWHNEAATTPAPDPAAFADDPWASDGHERDLPDESIGDFEADPGTVAIMLDAWRSSPSWLQMWGGRAPDGELAGWDERAARLAGHDRALLDELVTLDPARQRALALWAARRACERAEIDTLPWVADALERVTAGNSLSDAWRDGTVHDLLRQLADEDVTYSMVVVTSTDSPVERDRVPWAADVVAIDAVLGASEDHAGLAAAIAVGALLDAYDDVDEGLVEVRAALARSAG